MGRKGRVRDQTHDDTFGVDFDLRADVKAPETPEEGQETLTPSPAADTVETVNTDKAVKMVSSPSDSVQRLDVFLSARLPEAPTRSRVQRAIKDGGVLVNGDVVEKLSVKVRPGDEVTWLRDAKREAPGFVAAEDIPLQIYHEDGACIVLEKPAGMTVHPAKGLRSGTLVNALLHHVGCDFAPTSADAEDSDEDAEVACIGLSGGGTRSPTADDVVVRPGIVHRLDRGTTGVMVVAKHDAAHAALAAQFAARTSKRTYLALVWGLPVPSEGRVEASIGRDPRDRLRMTVVPTGKGKHAATHYSVVKAFDGGHASLVRFRLETGRTHQVRVHSLHMGHPLLGDATYGGAQLLRGPHTPERLKMCEQFFREDGVLARAALHAETLGFAHPASATWMSFSSELPGDMLKAMEMLRPWNEVKRDG